MVDVAISADRPGRTLHSVARHDAVPFPHVLPTTPPVPPPPGITRVHDLGELRAAVRAHVERTVAETGDWRAAIDGLRPVTAQLWRGLSEDDRRTFLTEDARAWDVRRHRMPPVTARRLADIDESGRWVRHTGTVVVGDPDRSTAYACVLTDGTELTVAAVVNCTGPVGALGEGPAPRRADPDRPRPPRPLGHGDRHGRRRARARCAAADDPLLRDRHAAPRQPVGDHGDAGDPRAGLRRGPLGVRARCTARSAVDPSTRTASRSPRTARRRPPTTRRSPVCSACRTASSRASSRRSRSTPASRRRTRRWPCWATSGVPSARGVRPSRPRTPRPPSATSTTARPASSTP